MEIFLFPFALDLGGEVFVNEELEVDVLLERIVLPFHFVDVLHYQTYHYR